MSEQLLQDLREATRDARAVLKDFKQAIHEARDITERKLIDGAVNEQLNEAIGQAIEAAQVHVTEQIKRVDDKMHSRYNKVMKELESTVELITHSVAPVELKLSGKKKARITKRRGQ